MTVKGEQKGRVEGVKESVRIVMLTIVSWLLTEGVVAKLVEQFGAQLDANTRLLVTGLILSVLKGIDKWLYKTDRTIIPLEGSTGLTGV